MVLSEADGAAAIADAAVSGYTPLCRSLSSWERMMRSQDAVRRVTIADVARHAGVSTAAVSKVLRNAYGVSAGMSQRVRSSMAELGYRPHAAARGLRGRSFTIGLL